MAVRTCPCGSGLEPTIAYDAKGIELGLICPRCEEAKMSKLPPDDDDPLGDWHRRNE